MKHFILEGQHLVPFEQRPSETIAAHRRFLQQGYDAGRFLLSGPLIPPDGGILVARASSVEELLGWLADEPFVKSNLMRWKSVIEFEPTQFNPLLAQWFGITPP